MAVALEVGVGGGVMVLVIDDVEDTLRDPGKAVNVGLSRHDRVMELGG